MVSFEILDPQSYIEIFGMSETRHFTFHVQTDTDTAVTDRTQRHRLYIWHGMLLLLLLLQLLLLIRLLTLPYSLPKVAKE